MNKYYRVNTDKVISEEIDHETVVINLDTGCYYHLNQSASLIFSLYLNTDCKDHIISLYQEIFSTDCETAAKDIIQVTDYLLERDFIFEVTEKSIIKDSLSAKMKYLPPYIEEFKDMQEMLLLDPIHEVKQEGWPYKKDE